jgi:hypothetical protein
MLNETTSFIKQYCWQMLMSIGYRFQQRLTTDFIQQMNFIHDADEFYQVRRKKTRFFNRINEDF